MTKSRFNPWTWLWVMVATLYLFLPLWGTFDFSLRMKRGAITFLAYQKVFADPKFLQSFRYSATMGVITVIVSIMLFVPTTYWIHLKLPRLRPVVELLTLLPFIIPVIVLVFGLIRTFSRPPFRMTQTEFTTDILITAGYVILSMPFMFWAVDVGMRAIDVRTLTEAAQSLGAGWLRVLLSVILPNLRVAILSGSLITFATVVGELILADFWCARRWGRTWWLLGAARLTNRLRSGF